MEIDGEECWYIAEDHLIYYAARAKMPKAWRFAFWPNTLMDGFLYADVMQAFRRKYDYAMRGNCKQEVTMLAKIRALLLRDKGGLQEIDMRGKY